MTELERYNKVKESFSKDGKLITANELLQKAANKWPHKLAVIVQYRNMYKQITFKELYEKAKIYGNYFKKLGIKQFDRVVIYYENSIEFYYAYFALWQINAIIVPLNVYLKPAEIENIIKDAIPKAIIVSEELKKNLNNIFGDIIIIDNMLEIENLELGQDNININNIVRDPNQTAIILYTSGTSGIPKGVMLSSANIIINAIQGSSRFTINSNERIYCPLPMFHSLPQNMCIWVSLIAGTTAIIVSKIERTSLLEAFQHKPTVVVAVPTIYGLFCRFKNLNFNNIRYCFSGGDNLPAKIEKYFELIYRRKIANGYGMTETSPFISINDADYTTAIGNVGKPFIGITVIIKDDMGQELPKNQIGEIWLKGENIMQGYYNSPEQTEKILKNGWLNTGDLGYINTDNELVLSGRSKDLIINKGIKIYPQEIEAILLKNPNVTQAAVIGKKEVDNTEEFPIAFIETGYKNNIELIQELKILCEKNLANYKVPRQFIIKKELPLTATGKINKKELKVD